MIGYKAFNSDLICRNFQYEVGKIYELDSKPVCCYNGFHFCKDLEECFYYYNFGSRVCEVESLGDIDTGDNKKFCTNRIKIIRELSFEEICNIIGIKINLANNLIKSFELTKDFYNKKCALLGGGWSHGLNAGRVYWYVSYGSGSWHRNVGVRLSKDFDRIGFFRWENFNKVLFECDNEKIYKIEKLKNEYSEWFEYLKNNLKF